MQAGALAKNWFYHPPMPQAFGSSGAQVGTGTALVLAIVTVLEVLAAVEIWLEAAKPVRARATTKARTTFFMMTTPKVVFTFCKFFWTIQMELP